MKPFLCGIMQNAIPDIPHPERVEGRTASMQVIVIQS
jgi:hypothetical protein